MAQRLSLNLGDAGEGLVDGELPGERRLVRAAALEVELEEEAASLVDAVQVHLAAEHPKVGLGGPSKQVKNEQDQGGV